MTAMRHSCCAAILVVVGVVVCAAKPSAQPSVEIFIGGQVARPGVYEIAAMDVLKAIDGTGPKDPASDYEVSITHTVVPKKLQRITRYTSLRALKDAPQETVLVQSGDIVELLQMNR